jgi:hypothetical protein
MAIDNAIGELVRLTRISCVNVVREQETQDSIEFINLRQHFSDQLANR